jgi:hypothetical protein
MASNTQLIHFLLIIATVAMSCKKDDDVIAENSTMDQTAVLLTSIHTGQDTGPGIAHVDFDPDSTFTVGPAVMSDSILLDLNVDGTGDFMVTYLISDPFMLGSSFRRLDIRPLGNAQVCVNPGDLSLVDTLVYGDVIDSSLTWSHSSSILYHYSWSMEGSSSTIGYFDNNTTYYVGLKLIANGNSYYAWLFTNGNAIDGYGITTEYYE